MKERFLDFVERRGGASVFVGAVLALLVLACLVFLLSVDPPWAGEASERLAAGKKLRSEDFAATYGWWAALVNLVLLGGTLACFRWWGKRRVYAGKSTRRAALPRWFWVALTGIVLIAGIWRAPRLNDSFWNDEEYAFRRYTWGEYERSDSASSTSPLVFDPVSSTDRVFKNKTGNNHVLHTVEASMGMMVWGWFAKADSTGFSEPAARFFPFLAGFATIALVGVAGALVGGPITGLGAALLLALSPWHIRYSVEARGYSTMLFGVMLAIICLVRALETGLWRWWLGFGLAQVVYLLSFPGSVYVAVAMNLVAVTCMLHRIWRKNLAAHEFARWGVASVLGAATVLQIMLPSVPQVLAYHEKTQVERAIKLNATWLRDYWTHLVAGVPPVVVHPEIAGGTGIDEMSLASSWVAPTIYLVLPVLTLLGTVLLVVRGGTGGRIIVGALWGGAALSFLHNTIGHTEMYGWYLLFTAPALAICLAWVAVGVCEKRRALGAGVLAVVVAGYALVTATPRSQMARVERQPMASVVQQVRGARFDFEESTEDEVLTGTFGVSDRQIRSYDPHVEIVETPEDLQTLVARARSSEKTLFIYFCGRYETANRDPGLIAMLDDSELFEKVGDVAGFEAFFSYEIFQLKES